MAEITEAIESSHAVVVVVSSDSVASDHVKREVAIAGEGNKLFVPIFLSEDIKLPLHYPLSGHHRVMAIPSLRAALPAIVLAAWTTVDRSRNRAAYNDVANLKDSERITYTREVNFASHGPPVGEFDGGLAAVEGGTYYPDSGIVDTLGGPFGRRRRCSLGQRLLRASFLAHVLPTAKIFPQLLSSIPLSG
jgi:hypothetical protein